MSTAGATVPGWPPIPGWEQSDLEALGAAGQLSGVNPEALAVIDSAESSGSGGGINPEGYGGFFGLGASSTYPAGASSSALLSNPGEASFEQQAVLAASTFNSYLSQAGGNPVTAEEIYQTGKPTATPGEGASLMAQYLGTSSAGGSPSSSLTSATTAGLNLNPFDLFGIPQAGASALVVERGPVSGQGHFGHYRPRRHRPRRVVAWPRPNPLSPGRPPSSLTLRCWPPRERQPRPPGTPARRGALELRPARGDDAPTRPTRLPGARCQYQRAHLPRRGAGPAHRPVAPDAGLGVATHREGRGPLRAPRRAQSDRGVPRRDAHPGPRRAHQRRPVLRDRVIGSTGFDTLRLGVSCSAVTVSNFTDGTLTVTQDGAAGGGGTAPNQGAGVVLVPSGVERTFLLRGQTITTYGIAGASFGLQAFARPRDPTAGNAVAAYTPSAGILLALANPAAGADFTFNPSPGAPWQPISLFAQLVTSAAVANRLVALRLTSGASVFFEAAVPVAIPASTTLQLSAAPAPPCPRSSSARRRDATLPLPSGWFPAGTTLSSSTLNIQAADQWSLLALVYAVQT